MIRYRPLLAVDIAHDYFLSRGDVVFEAQADAERTALSRLYSVGDFLEVFPDDATRSVLAGYKMLFRATDTGFVVSVRLDPSASDTRPMVPPADDLNLTFVLRTADARFANYTELGPLTTGFYRFGNDSQNRTGDVNFLSRRASTFDTSRSYVAGEVFLQAAAPTFDLFLALRDTGPAATPIAADWRRIPVDTFSTTATYRTGAVVLSGNALFRALVDSPGTDLTNAAEWQAAGVLGNQYVTVADALLLMSSLFDFDISDLAVSQATVRVFTPTGTVAAIEQTFTAEQGTLGDVQMDLRPLAQGAYRVEIVDASATVLRAFPCYLAPEARSANWFGVIEIGVGAGDFALLNADGTLRSPRYVLRFLNRATRWRYIFPSAQAVGTGAEVAPVPGNDRVLVTAAPRPLTRFGTGSRLQADSPATPAVSEEILLPAPGAQLIRRESAEWFSETHVPNFTVGP
ncbi:MAG: hypothetical protein DMF87_09930 [Acidobacteria bacterium]|nr:MAG: hypothetical protein DMF88_25570 [Acidobacteriota bacterium]PYR80018.1 MAG: hypothetical protein DMF87_09930 [Acidobacteriota bacterium]